MKFSVNITSKTIIIFLILIILAIGILIFINFKGPGYSSPVLVKKIPISQSVALPIQEVNDYPVPASLPYKTELYNNQSPEPLKAIFRPVGWSKKGKFAYVIEPADEACGCYMFILRIQDLITDKILWEYTYNDNATQFSNPPKDINSIWSLMYSTFSEKLKFHQISSNVNFELRSIPIIQDDYRYDFPVENKYISNVDGLNVINSTSIYLKRNGNTVIKIFSKHDDSGISSTLDNTIQGYLASPFENRIAMIYSYMQRGYEGPPNTVHLEVIGCDLNYKK